MSRPKHSTQCLRFERLGAVATLTLDRVARRNRVDVCLAQALCAVAEEIEHDDSIRVVVLEARGPIFCLGAEPELATGSLDWVEAVAGITRPLIAVIQGDAVAAGLELALACDIRIASDRAHFAMPQVAAGVLPSCGGTQRLPRLIGASRALELLLTGRSLDAAEAQAIGLVSRVVAHRRLQPSARALAQDLARRGPIALRYAKEAVLKEDLYVLLQTSADRAEGVRAFLNKRPPRFHGK